ncbi:MAG: Clp protease ClpP [Bacteroides sp.]|nr:Clp protease ClpP [Eubacterium sp.]MCM1419297.1 Clp protease ClpP [Roseburia sp.]MCM1463415.1 Clp protease ClpP [Bacteroides sp.]
MKMRMEVKQMEKTREAKTLDVYIYDTIESDGRDFWTGAREASETSANTFLKRIEEAGGDELSEVNIHINSLGGDCSEGNAIANAIRQLKAWTTAYIDGYACSAASVIACACRTVRMPRNTVMFLHNPWTTVSGNAKELRKKADDLEKLGEAFATIYTEKSRGRLAGEKLKALLDNETYLTAEEAQKYGLCDLVVQYDASYTIPDGEAAKQFGADAGRIAAMANPALPSPQRGGEPLHRFAVSSPDRGGREEAETGSVISDETRKKIAEYLEGTPLKIHGKAEFERFVEGVVTLVEGEPEADETAPKSAQDDEEGTGDGKRPPEEKNTEKERDFADTAVRLLFNFFEAE